MLGRGLARLRRWLWPVVAGLLMVLGVLLWFSPAERTLGQVVKLVYLHGALVRAAIILMLVSLPVNLVGLVGGRRAWLAWGQALTWTGVGIWLVHTLFSILTTYAAWGVFIAWAEPRTRFTFTLAGVGLLVVVGAYLVANARFAALVFGLLAALTLLFLPRLGFVQHPLDPIGTSPSGAIQLFYALILATTTAIGGLVALWLQDRLRR